MENSTKINWFPGHMAKTRKQINDDLKLVDVVYELVDARIPMSSRNPEIDSICLNKPRILILNKSDLADPDQNILWKKYFENKGIKTVLFSCANPYNLNEIFDITYKLIDNKIEKLKSKNIVNYKPKIMVVGIPNVGKSTFINKICKKSGLKAENRPGVTRQKQWVTSSNSMMLLDTPGVLWPKFENEITGRNLALTGAIKDDIIDIEELVVSLIEFFKKNYSKEFMNRYNLKTLDDETINIYDNVAKNRGCLIKGGEADYNRTAKLILDDLRNNLIARITLEFPEDY